MNKKIASALTLLLVAVIWGSAFVAQSKGMEHIGPFTYNFSRSVIGAAVLLPVIAVRSGLSKRRGEKPSPGSKRVTLVGGICCGAALCAASAFQQIGISMTTAGKAGFITALYIVIVPLMGIFLKRRIHPAVWICVAVAAAGFYLLCVKEGFSVGAGDLLVLCCAVIFSVHIMVIDRFDALGADCVKMSCIQFAVTAVLSAVPMLIFESPEMPSIWDARLSILYAGVLSSGVAYTLQIAAQKHADPTAATLIMSLESVFAALSGWLILGEVLSVKELIGCGLVLAAGAYRLRTGAGGSDRGSAPERGRRNSAASNGVQETR